MTVKIKPGASPSTEYEYGKDMIARQMYSENSRADVCAQDVSRVNQKQLSTSKRIPPLQVVISSSGRSSGRIGVLSELQRKG